MISHAIRDHPGTPFGFSLTRTSVENTFSVDAGRVSAPMVSEFFYELHICNFDSILYAQVTPFRLNGQLQIIYHNFYHISFFFFCLWIQLNIKIYFMKTGDYI